MALAHRRRLARPSNEAGAIREEVGSEGHGAYWPPQSNEEYGAREAPLLQRNGDPVSDLLYTSNFALLGLHEAADATGDPRYASAAELGGRYMRSSADQRVMEGVYR